MHHSNILALLAATAGAQSVVTILNIFEYQSTLTQIGADSTAMTYKKDCASPVDGRTGSSSKFCMLQPQLFLRVANIS